jgi:hypothetical protein
MHSCRGQLHINGRGKVLHVSLHLHVVQHTLTVRATVANVDLLDTCTGIRDVWTSQTSQACMLTTIARIHYGSVWALLLYCHLVGYCISASGVFALMDSDTKHKYHSVAGVFGR